MVDQVKFLECSCKDNSHLVVVKCDTWETDMPEVYISYQLNTYLPWYKRIVHAIRYVFGRRNDGSSWDTTILTDQGVQDLEAVIKDYKKSKKSIERNKLKLPTVKGMKF